MSLSFPGRPRADLSLEQTLLPEALDIQARAIDENHRNLTSALERRRGLPRSTAQVQAGELQTKNERRGGPFIETCGSSAALSITMAFFGGAMGCPIVVDCRQCITAKRITLPRVAAKPRISLTYGRVPHSICLKTADGM